MNTPNMFMGIPSRKNRVADPFGGREAIIFESNEGQHSSNRITFSSALANTLNLSDDNVYVNITGFTSDDDGHITELFIVPVADGEGFRLTKKNGTKPRSMSDKKLHGFLSKQLLNVKGELSSDMPVTFTVLAGESLPSALSNFSWALRLSEIVTPTEASTPYEAAAVEQTDEESDAMSESLDDSDFL